MYRWLALSALVFLLDQLTKLWAEGVLTLHQPVPVMSSFNLTLMYNEGAAFSFLSDQGGWQRGFLIVLAIGVTAVLVAWLFRLKPGERRVACGLTLVIGGALGNVFDRIIHGHVIDFIDVYYNDWHWPAFNVADSAITLGVILLLLDSLFHKDTPNPE
ncbi:MAG TPA: lipoprotein signal peptidase [Chromatiales bacterium]|nr:lipoprotein signal peptidase [Chromatiales bacterium]